MSWAAEKWSIYRVWICISECFHHRRQASAMPHRHSFLNVMAQIGLSIWVSNGKLLLISLKVITDFGNVCLLIMRLTSCIIYVNHMMPMRLVTKKEYQGDFELATSCNAWFMHVHTFLWDICWWSWFWKLRAFCDGIFMRPSKHTVCLVVNNIELI